MYYIVNLSLFRLCSSGGAGTETLRQGCGRLEYRSVVAKHSSGLLCFTIDFQKYLFTAGNLDSLNCAVRLIPRWLLDYRHFLLLIPRYRHYLYALSFFFRVVLLISVCLFDALLPFWFCVVFLIAGLPNPWGFPSDSTLYFWFYFLNFRFCAFILKFSANSSWFWFDVLIPCCPDIPIPFCCPSDSALSF
jgi:hypothetical protein